MGKILESSRNIPKLYGIYFSFRDTPQADRKKKEGSVYSTKRIAFSAVLIAVTVVLSPFYFPIGTTKCFPAQHMINAIAGVTLGPLYAVFMALVTGVIRNLFGLGTIHAFPGGIPGAFVVGLLYKYLWKKDYVAFTEPLGTVVIGATISALVVAPWQGSSLTLSFFWTAFAASSIPGSSLGFVILKGLRRVGFVKNIVQ